jgi:hypothetical protein
MARIVSTTSYDAPNRASRATLAALKAQQEAYAAQTAEITKPRVIASPLQGFAQLAQQFVAQRNEGRAQASEAEGREELARLQAKYYANDGQLPPEEMQIVMERDPEIGQKIAAEGLRQRQELQKLTEERKYTEGREAFKWDRDVNYEQQTNDREKAEAAELDTIERQRQLTDAEQARKQELADKELARARQLTDLKTAAERDAAKIEAQHDFELGPKNELERSNKSTDRLLDAQQKSIETSVAEENKIAAENRAVKIDTADELRAAQRAAVTASAAEESKIAEENRKAKADAELRKTTPLTEAGKLKYELNSGQIDQPTYDARMDKMNKEAAAKAPELSRPASADDRKNWNLDKSGNYKMVSKDGGQNWSPVGVGGGGAGDKLMTPEAAARIALANEYLKNSDNVRTSAAAGEMTGPIDYQTSVRLGKGNGGVAFRQLKQGTEAYVRMMTGAGMAISEAQEKAMQYEPQWTDTAEVLTSKVDGLNAALKAIVAEATLGRQTTGGDEQQPPPQQEQAQPSTPAPAGVDQSLWDEMTPEEKAAFQ